MSEILTQIKLFFINLSTTEFLLTMGLIIILVLVLLKKFCSKFYNKILGKVEKYLKPLSDEAVLRSAEYLNSESGQAKMDAAVRYVQEKSITSPWYIRIFLQNFNKKWLVDVIERAYQEYKETMNSNIPDEQLDIKGNEIKKN